MTQLPFEESPPPPPIHTAMDDNNSTVTATTSNDTYRHSTDHPNTTPTDITERYLLARAKDERYVEQCARLVLSILLQFVPLQYPRNDDSWFRWIRSIGCGTTTSRRRRRQQDPTNTTSTMNTDGDHSMTVLLRNNRRKQQQLLTIIAEYMSWILYIVLATKSSSSSIKNDSRDSNSSSSNSNNNQKTHRSNTVLTTPGMDICQLDYRTTTGPSVVTNNSNDYMRQSSLSSSFLQHVQSVSPLIVITSIWYGIRYWSHVLQQQQQQQITEQQSSPSPPQQQHDYNHLTGSSRQNIFHSQQQEMIRRSHDMARVGQDSIQPSSSSTSATAVTPKTPSPRSITAVINTPPPPTSSCTTIFNLKLRQRLRSILEAFIVSLDTAIQSLPTDGPHSTNLLSPSTTTTAATTTTTAPISNTDDMVEPATTTTTITPLIHVIQWLYQIYMAYYYVRGSSSDPTQPLHRLLPFYNYRLTDRHGNKTGMDRANCNHGLSVSQPTTVDVPNLRKHTIIPMVGTLVMIQLIWKLVLYGISQPILEYSIRIQWRKRWQKAWYRMKTSLGLRSSSSVDNGETFIYMEGNLPIDVTTSATAASLNSDAFQDASMDHHRDESDPSIAVVTTSSPMCGICRNSASTSFLSNRHNYTKTNNNGTMLHPSCSIQCGHIYCWYCIQQWLTYYDTKCPICRTKCTPNDIQLLYNY